jgi:hypothetical protein
MDILARYKTLRDKEDYSLKLKNFYFYRHNFNIFRDSPANKFFIFGQGRSGSSLLVSLLGSHPDIYCDSEIFGSPASGKFLSPYLYIRHCSRKQEAAEKDFYGFKVKGYQLRKDQAIERPEILIEQLINKGWKMIYLVRENILQHAFSSLMAEHVKAWTIKGSYTPQPITVNCHRLKEIADWRIEQHKLDAPIVEAFPHIRISYEQDLANVESQIAGCNKIFNFLGAADYRVTTSLKKMTSSSLQENITNYNEVELFLQGTYLHKYL